MMNIRVEEIKRLQEEIRELSESSENKRRYKYWKQAGISNDYWHGLPKDKEYLPFTVEMEREAYANVIGFSLNDFYQDPYSYIASSLKMMLYKFKNFKDCTPIGKTIVYYPGAGYEKSIFGGEPVYSKHDAWMSRENIISERIDIGSLKYPDFYKSGSMPYTHQFYDRLRELLDQDFILVFPQWNRSPWGVAWHLRGLDNLLFDIMDDEEWVGEFLQYLTESRKRWTVERAKFLNTEITTCNIYNDEITSPVVSPNIYKNLIRPTEIELSNFFGGVNFWHSCGNTTPFMKLINEIPGLHMITVSAWSSIEEAVKCYDKDNVTLEIQLHPYDGIIKCNDADYYKKTLIEIKDKVKGNKATIRAEGIQMCGSSEVEIPKVKKWIDCANDILLL